MVQCCVPHCTNRSDCQNWKRTNNVDNNRKITFHSFPKNDSTRKLWMDVLGLPAHISNTARICSDHFPSVAFDINSLRTRLKRNVLPCKKIIPKTKEREEEDAVATCLQSSTSDKTTMAQPSMEEKATMMSLEETFNSQEKCLLRRALHSQKEKFDKKIQWLRQIIRRRDKRIATPYRNIILRIIDNYLFSALKILDNK